MQGRPQAPILRAGEGGDPGDRPMTHLGHVYPELHHSGPVLGRRARTPEAGGDDQIKRGSTLLEDVKDVGGQEHNVFHQWVSLYVGLAFSMFNPTVQLLGMTRGVIQLCPWCPCSQAGSLIRAGSQAAGDVL